MDTKDACYADAYDIRGEDVYYGDNLPCALQFRLGVASQGEIVQVSLIR